MKRFLLAIVFCVAPGLALADAGDTATVELFQCELKEGKTMEEVKANNTRWLAHTRKVTGSEDVNSYAMSPMVGDLTKFMFADVYPTAAAWATAKSAAESDEGQAIEDAFNELMDCTRNMLYESTQH